MDNSKSTNQGKNHKLIRYVLYAFSLIMLVYSIYNYLVPHKVLIEDTEYMRLTGRGFEMDSEVSIVGFIFSVGFWTILPIFIGKKYFDKK